MPEYIWDEEKNKINFYKHGVDFSEARSVFKDDDALYSFDGLHSQDEDRWTILGESNKAKTLYVVYCVREMYTIRIISARKATKNERKEYYERKYGIT
ncbi:MAG: BrnT family toxin [Ruminococcus sp.]|jgi:uncharacterized DUF497 family protein|nr:BrnT family toxin [Ruminococcus sp.]